MKQLNHLISFFFFKITYFNITSETIETVSLKVYIPYNTRILRKYIDIIDH
jgi:hypothetical protein